MAQQAQSASSPSNKQHDEVELNPPDIAHSPKHLDQDGSVVSAIQTTPVGRDAPSSHSMESTRVFEDAPLMPSELIESYETATAPTQLYAEDSSFTTQTPLDYDAPLFPHRPSNPPDRNFAIVANDMINKALGRTPGGNSVIEPDSVLGESGRLYHGYNAGKLNKTDWIFNISSSRFSLTAGSLLPLYQMRPDVLDIGCGTGLWATDFAEQNPSSFVVGSDLSAIQPQASVPNCIFVKDDAELPWYFPEPNPGHAECQGACDHFISFDYVHLRMMFSCFEDTRNVLRNAYDNMTPGGWIEFQDSSFDVRQGNPDFEGNALIRYGQACIRGAAVKGRDILKSEKYEEWLEETGLS
ncbi:methyltransferase domain-containing protein [Seiridium cupressi]